MSDEEWTVVKNRKLTSKVSESNVDKIVKLLKEYEGSLSDGYQYYTRNHSQVKTYTEKEVLTQLANKILKALNASS